ncbi:MAG TPA: hypothetical protein VIM79_05955 [Niastella sp.]
MKKFFIATGISLMALSGCAYTQTGNALAANRIKPMSAQNQYLNDINVRAMRDFVTRYGDVDNAMWHKSNGNYVAVFFRDSVQYRTVYSGRGDLSFIMKYYEEKQMPRNIRAQVKSTYYDYKIFVIQEIEVPDHPTVYIVNLQGDTDWKKVKLCQGEMEVMEEFRKDK